MDEKHGKPPFQFGLGTVLWITTGLAAASVGIARWSPHLGEVLATTTLVAAVYLRARQVEPENPVAVLCFMIIYLSIAVWGVTLAARLVYQDFSAVPGTRVKGYYN